MLSQVLYIDDDPTASLIFRLASKKAGYSKEVITAGNGLQALDYYEQLLTKKQTQDPQVVFLDLDMPMMGGWEFLEEFMQNYYSSFKSTRFYIISSSINPQDRIRAKQYPPVLDFVAKPITSILLRELDPFNSSSGS
ncbi:response regulator [Telluribacter humicola]|uniref:response regulator n=1 Tax=Telluribacter humicola TaxID=1720261 RepID=UPI001A973A93|nr:response regulator [Telluribacter humicola]